MVTSHFRMEYFHRFNSSIFVAELERRLDVNYDTAWNILMKMRSMMINVLPEQVMNSITEIDEAWFGKKQNRDILY